ncbi:MAG: sugar phosphate isomerase/epimerase family protein [Chloroflexota bacterium]
MRNKFYGACTWIFGDLPLPEIAKCLARLGYSGVELLGEIEKYPAAQARRLLDDQGLGVFSMTPTQIDLAHPDTRTRKEALDYYFRLLDYAAQVGSPLISCHGAVGRVRAITSWQHELDLLIAAVRSIAERAEQLGLQVALELLNRYETHLLNNVEQALDFVSQVGLLNVGIHLDAYHMNIEEPNPAGAILAADQHLFLFHVADSNRQAVGRGHTDFGTLIRALDQVGYTGPIVIECVAPGPDPFRAIKDESSETWVETYLQESLAKLRALDAKALPHQPKRARV